ncbi:MAG TPA: hypothetical protein VGN46_09435 [Luteibacter sp.]|jgi:hypothetical protein|uniref:hypothetical protein n=1 Tax=Luteibacter sp. TaxID=1886636 RepID=UPI002F40ED22
MLQQIWLHMPAWLKALFAAESQAEKPNEPRMPEDAIRLHAGQRVEFELHQGVDGPWYATEVRVNNDETPF